MPIVYEQAQPNPAAIASAYGAAQTRLQAAPQIAGLQMQSRQIAYGAAADANRLAGQLGSQDADRLQAGQIAAARQDLDERQFAAAGTPTDRDSFLMQAAQANENQRFQNQAALIGVELTTQERMRLSRMKNAIGDVQNDPSLSDEEKADLTVQLRTGINPLEQRLAKQKFEMDKMVKEEMVNAKRAETALQSERLKFISGEFDQHIKIVADPKTQQQAIDVVRDLYPDLAPGSPEFKAEVEKQVIETGNFIRMKPNAKGDMEPIDESKHGDVGKGARGGKGPGGQMTQQEFARAYADVLATVAKDETVPADQKDAVARKRFDAVMAAHQQYQAAAQPAKPAPFHPGNLSTATPDQRTQIEKMRMVIGFVNTRKDVPPEEKARVQAAGAQLQKMVAKYTAADGTIQAPKAVRDRMLELQGLLNRYDPTAKATAPPASLDQLFSRFGAAPPPPAVAPAGPLPDGSAPIY